jgi:hypothetical protein
MATDEIEAVLADWIGQALSPIGQLPGGVSPSEWVAARFSEWWRGRTGDAFDDADRAASSLHDELNRTGSDEALHELAHLRAALVELRSLLGLPDEPPRLDA